LPRQHLLRETRPLARRLKPNALDKPPLQCAAVRENPACGAHARARACARTAAGALASNRVDLVDEDDAGRVLLGLREEVAHAARAHAHEHLKEKRATKEEKGRTREREVVAETGCE
jgi:hypothetical protein